MEAEAKCPKRGGGIVAMCKTPNGIEFADAKDIADTATDFDVRNMKSRKTALLKVESRRRLRIFSPGEFENHQFAQVEIPQTGNMVEEDASAVPSNVQTHIEVGGILEIIHQRKAIRVKRITLVTLKMVQQGKRHMPELIPNLEGIIQFAS